MIALCYLTIFAFSSITADVIVNTPQGSLRGYTATSTRDGTSYAGFLGIPYATPPTGELRFKAPVRHPGWQGIRNATTKGAPCFQSGTNSNAREDCLFLNIFVPNFGSPSTELKAVMLFVHGGGFRDGSGDPSGSAPDFYVDHDVIFATLNYRLGPLGFMSLQIADNPGNAGLKDVIMALKWMNQNIESFGGDPKKVTLFGESAGGGVVSFVQLSKMAEGLIARTIHESGEALQSWTYVTPEQAISRAYRLGKIIGCDISDVTEAGRKQLLECFMKKTPDEISIHQTNIITAEDHRRATYRQFVPTKEPNLAGAALIRHPIEDLQLGDFVQVPSILGSNLREGLLYLGDLNALDPSGNLFGQNMTNFIPVDLIANLNDSMLATIGGRIKDFYLDGQDVSLATRQKVVDIRTDTNFVMGMMRQSSLMKTFCPVYNYYFTYDGPFTGFRQNPANDNIAAPGHGDELGYLMNPQYLRSVYAKYDRNSLPHKTIDRMITMWTNFAKFGDPTPNIDGTISVKWKPLTENEHNFLEIGNDLTLKKGLASDRMKFWNEMYQLGQKIKPFPE